MANRIGPMDQGMLGKIGDKVGESGTNGKVSTGKVATDRPSSGADAAKSASTSDTVELTSSAKLLERLEKTLASLPAVDAARVAEVKLAIEKGDYQVDPEKIADAMIRLEQELGD